MLTLSLSLLTSFLGIDCSIVPTCYNVSGCSGRGICIDYDVCKCQKEWTGKNCTQFSCASLDFCSGRVLRVYQLCNVDNIYRVNFY